MAMEVKKVLIRKDGVKYIIVPKNSQLKAGDLVKLIRMEGRD
jgi:virulence-associated protein VagC